MSREEVTYHKVVCDRCEKTMKLEGDVKCHSMGPIKLLDGEGQVIVEHPGHEDLCAACATTIKNNLEACVSPPKRSRKKAEEETTEEEETPSEDPEESGDDNDDDDDDDD